MDLKIILQPTKQHLSNWLAIMLVGDFQGRLVVSYSEAGGLVELLVQSALSVEAEFSKPPEASPKGHQLLKC